MKSIVLFVILLFFLVSPVAADAPAQCKNTNASASKYKPGPCHESIGGANCTGRCAAGPMRISPDPIEACEGEEALINIRIEGGRMATFGDTIENSGGDVDWGDGKEEGLGTCCNWDKKHTYLQAKTYHLSVTFGEQSTNANNPPGGCSYRCRLQQAATVIIHQKNAPECAGGKFKKSQ
jgi:hypothetical protein